MLHRIVIGVGIVYTMLTLGSLLGRFHWALDVLSHFNIQFAITLLVFVAAAIVLRVNPRWTVLFVVGLLPNIVVLWPYFVWNAATAADEVETLRLAAINVYARNTDYASISSYLREADADLVVLTEIREQLADDLNMTIGDLYPHQHVEPSRGTFGLAFLSKEPFLSAETVQMSERRRYLKVVLDHTGQPVTFFSIHPLPPLNQRWADFRNDELQYFAMEAAEIETPLVLMGDFNATPWSYHIQQLNDEANLRPANYGFGVRPTWFYWGVIQAPLDYMLISPEWDVVHYEVGRSVSSDHLPVVAEVQLRR